jgi:hypothetical protein
MRNFTAITLEFHKKLFNFTENIDFFILFYKIDLTFFL